MGTRIMILAGGTGGHVYPALAVAQEALSKGHEVVWMGTQTGLEARVAPAAGIPIEWLTVSGVRGKGWQRQCLAPFMLASALREAYSILRRVRPHVVLGMGGFVSGPGGLLCSLLGIPLVLHEQNRIPGTTNRWLSRFVKKATVLEAFPGTFPLDSKAYCTGNPLRRRISELTDIKRNIPISSDGVYQILVIGGSLGAKALNETVPYSLLDIGKSIRVWHQTGEASREKTEHSYKEIGIEARVDAFIEDMAEAYSWADLVICRAGALTVSELSVAGRPAIFIPFPYAIDDHQTHNARTLSESGAAVLLPQTELTTERLHREIVTLLDQPERLRYFSDELRKQAKPEATETVLNMCLEKAGVERF